MLVFIKLLLAHVLADFPLQPKWLVELKTKSIPGAFLHASVFCLVAAVLFNNTLTARITVAILLIGAAHFAIDLLKTRYFSGPTWLFLADQALHVIAIALASLVILHIPSDRVFRSIADSLNSPKFLILAIAFIIATGGGSAFVSAVTRPFLEQIPPGGLAKGLKNAGLYIGWFERLIVLALTLTGNFTGIGFVFAAKSVIRFPEAQTEKHFAEYYLIGTMASFVSAILVGIIATFLLRHMSIFG